MSPSSPPIEPAVLVVIIGETVLQGRIINLLQDLHVTGYTLSQAQGAGRHGSRRGDMVGYNTNFEIKTVVSLEVSEAIFSGLVEYQSDHALIAFRQNVEALTGFKIST
ncbi:MAG: P-II family nitrogen regulator [Microcoleus sp.]